MTCYGNVICDQQLQWKIINDRISCVVTRRSARNFVTFIRSRKIELVHASEVQGRAARTHVSPRLCHIHVRDVPFLLAFATQASLRGIFRGEYDATVNAVQVDACNSRVTFKAKKALKEGGRGERKTTEFFPPVFSPGAFSSFLRLFRADDTKINYSFISSRDEASRNVSLAR